MEAYYDEKLKRWIFPDTDLDEVAKPLAPPPIMPKKSDAPATPAPAAAAASNDPLAALMAPPPGLRVSSQKKRTPATSRYADPLASMGNVAPPSGMKLPPASPMMKPPPATPTFAVFQPKPSTQAAPSDPSKEEKK